MKKYLLCAITLASLFAFCSCEKQKNIPEENAYICFQNIDSIYELEMRAEQAIQRLPDTTYILFVKPLTDTIINVYPSTYIVSIYSEGVDLNFGFLPTVQPFDTIYIRCKRQTNFIKD